jgi:nucleoside-diphosphate-sugar epimerase
MKVVVTGGTGFLGRHVVWRLAAAGHAVVFSGRNRDAAAQVAALAGQRVQFAALTHGTESGRIALAECSRGADAIVHCAALASPWGRASAFEQCNVDAVRDVLGICKENGIGKLVHISSPSIYFDFIDRLNVREDSPLPPPVNDYARTKRAAEALVLNAHLPHSIILRPRAIFGPWDNTLLPRLLRLIRIGRVPLLRGGSAMVDMSYVENVVDAVEASLALPCNPADAAPVFNISNGEPLAIRDLLKRISDAFGLPLNPVDRPYVLVDRIARLMETGARLAPGWEPPFTRYSLGTIAFSQTLDLSRAKTLLAYRPHVTLDDGIARTAQWWRSQRAHGGAPQ